MTFQPLQLGYLKTNFAGITVWPLHFCRIMHFIVSSYWIRHVGIFARFLGDDSSTTFSANYWADKSRRAVYDTPLFEGELIRSVGGAWMWFDRSISDRVYMMSPVLHFLLFRTTFWLKIFLFVETRFSYDSPMLYRLSQGFRLGGSWRLDLLIHFTATNAYTAIHSEQLRGRLLGYRTIGLHLMDV